MLSADTSVWRPVALCRGITAATLLRLIRKFGHVPDWGIDHALTPLVALPQMMDAPMPNEHIISRLSRAGRNLAIDGFWRARRKCWDHPDRAARRLCRRSP